MTYTGGGATAGEVIQRKPGRSGDNAKESRSEMVKSYVISK